MCHINNFVKIKLIVSSSFFLLILVVLFLIMRDSRKNVKLWITQNSYVIFKNHFLKIYQKLWNNISIKVIKETVFTRRKWCGKHWKRLENSKSSRFPVESRRLLILVVLYTAFFLFCEREVQLSGYNSGTTCFTRIYWHVGFSVC